MKNLINVFISHASEDADLARAISNSLKMMTAGQIETWFSTSSLPGEGLMGGDVWFNQILDMLAKSRIILVLLTPNSIDRRWVYFEAGFAQGHSECTIIPICAGISVDDVKPPLSHFQCCQLSDYNAAKEFYHKLLSSVDIPFYEQLYSPTIETVISKVQEVKLLKRPVPDRANISKEMLDDLRSHIDKRFMEIVTQKANYGNDYSYTINIENLYKPDQATQHILIKSSESVEDILDRLYFLIQRSVKPYTYLQSWILRNKLSGVNMVMYEICGSVNATQVFMPNSTWQIIPLEETYKPQLASFYHGFGSLK